MTVEEFSKYVIDNLHRASMSNALNIADKLLNKTYDADIFVTKCAEYAVEKCSSNKISYKELSGVLSAICNYNDRLKLSMSFTIVIDNLIVDMWRAFHSK